jgi:hypothetical protein
MQDGAARHYRGFAVLAASSSCCTPILPRRRFHLVVRGYNDCEVRLAPRDLTAGADELGLIFIDDAAVPGTVR